MIKEIRTQIVPSYLPGSRLVDCKSHLDSDGLRAKEIGDVLLRATNGIRKLGLRPKDADSSLDVGANIHTSFLVDFTPHFNKETCLAPHKQAGILQPVMTIAENLKARRKIAGLSQVQLAEKASVSQQLISQIENGRNRDTTRLPELAKALGCKVEDIDPDYYLLPDDAHGSDIVERFKSILATGDEAALHSVSEHLDFVLHRLSGDKGGKREGN